MSDQIEAALAQVHGQDARRLYSVAEVKQIVYPLVDALSAAQAVIEEAKAKLAEDGHDGARYDNGCEVFAILSKFPSGKEEGR